MNIFNLQFCVVVVFFVITIILYTYTISSRNNASIYNFSILFDGKVNLVSAYRLGRSKFAVVFKSTWRNELSF